MAIWVNAETRVLIQGISGHEGRRHAAAMQAYGTRVVAGVAPGRGGQRIAGIPVFNTVEQAMRAEAPTASCLFVPAALAADAIAESAAAGLALLVCITEGIPVQDMLRVAHFLKSRGTVLIGPNSPGLIVPGRTKVGIMPAGVFRPGPIAVLSRSGTLTYEIVHQLTHMGLGQSICIGIGGDAVVGSSYVTHLERLCADDATRGIVLIGEIGGRAEETAAAYIARQVRKPVLALIAGLTAPRGQRLGHAGAVIEGRTGKAADKAAALAAAGIRVAPDLMAFTAAARETFGALTP